MRIVSSVVVLLAGCQLVFPLDEKSTPPTSDALEDSGVVTCPEFYETGSTGIYFAESEPTSWPAAKSKCESHGATTHLVVISDFSEFDVVRGLVGAEGFSIGLSRRQSPAFIWVTAEPTTFAATPGEEPWAPGEPNNGGAGGTPEDCAVVRVDGLLNDIVCSTFQTGFVCECDKFAPR